MAQQTRAHLYRPHERRLRQSAEPTDRELTARIAAWFIRNPTQLPTVLPFRRRRLVR